MVVLTITAIGSVTCLHRLFTPPIDCHLLKHFLLTLNLYLGEQMRGQAFDAKLCHAVPSKLLTGSMAS